jgi:hypothetical protein
MLLGVHGKGWRVFSRQSGEGRKQFFFGKKEPKNFYFPALADETTPAAWY